MTVWKKGTPPASFKAKCAYVSECSPWRVELMTASFRMCPHWWRCTHFPLPPSCWLEFEYHGWSRSSHPGLIGRSRQPWETETPTMVETERAGHTDGQGALAPALGWTSDLALHNRVLGYATVFRGFLSLAAEQTNPKWHIRWLLNWLLGSVCIVAQLFLTPLQPHGL